MIYSWGQQICKRRFQPTWRPANKTAMLGFSEPEVNSEVPLPFSHDPLSPFHTSINSIVWHRDRQPPLAPYSNNSFKDWSECFVRLHAWHPYLLSTLLLQANNPASHHALMCQSQPLPILFRTTVNKPKLPAMDPDKHCSEEETKEARNQQPKKPPNVAQAVPILIACLAKQLTTTLAHWQMPLDKE